METRKKTHVETCEIRHKRPIIFCFSLVKSEPFERLKFESKKKSTFFMKREANNACRRKYCIFSLFSRQFASSLRFHFKPRVGRVAVLHTSPSDGDSALIPSSVSPLLTGILLQLLVTFPHFSQKFSFKYQFSYPTSDENSASIISYVSPLLTGILLQLSVTFPHF